MIDVKKLFSEQYANHNAIGHNYLLLAMYRCANPFAIILNRLGFTPNLITTISTTLAISASVALVIEDGWLWFSILWLISVLLDFCDGTVARMSGKVRQHAFRYDHMSDLFKIFVVFMGACLRYNDTGVWIAIFLSMFLFMYFTVLNHDHWCAQENKRGKLSGTTEVNQVAQDNSAVVEKHAEREDRYIEFLDKLLRGGYSIVTTINGHTLLLFLFLPHGAFLTILLSSYFGLVSLIHIIKVIRKLVGAKK